MNIPSTDFDTAAARCRSLIRQGWLDELQVEAQLIRHLPLRELRIGGFVCLVYVQPKAHALLLTAGGRSLLLSRP